MVRAFIASRLSCAPVVMMQARSCLVARGTRQRRCWRSGSSHGRPSTRRVLASAQWRFVWSWYGDDDGGREEAAGVTSNLASGGFVYARGTAAIDLGSAAIFGILVTQCIVPFIAQASVRTATRCNVERNTVLRRVEVCCTLSSAIARSCSVCDECMCAPSNPCVRHRPSTRVPPQPSAARSAR